MPLPPPDRRPFDGSKPSRRRTSACLSAGGPAGPTTPSAPRRRPVCASGKGFLSFGRTSKFIATRVFSLDHHLFGFFQSIPLLSHSRFIGRCFVHNNTAARICECPAVRQQVLCALLLIRHRYQRCECELEVGVICDAGREGHSSIVPGASRGLIISARVLLGKDTEGSRVSGEGVRLSHVYPTKSSRRDLF